MVHTDDKHSARALFLSCAASLSPLLNNDLVGDRGEEEEEGRLSCWPSGRPGEAHEGDYSRGIYRFCIVRMTDNTVKEGHHGKWPSRHYVRRAPRDIFLSTKHPWSSHFPTSLILSRNGPSAYSNNLLTNNNPVSNTHNLPDSRRGEEIRPSRRCSSLLEIIPRPYPGTQ